MEENEVGNLGILLTEIDHEPFFFYSNFPPLRPISLEPGLVELDVDLYAKRAELMGITLWERSNMFALFRIITLIPGSGWRIEFLKQVFSSDSQPNSHDEDNFLFFLGQKRHIFSHRVERLLLLRPQKQKAPLNGERSGMASADVLFTLSKLP